MRRQEERFLPQGKTGTERKAAVDFDSMDHSQYMGEAIREALEAGGRGDRPIGAVIVHNGKVVSRGSSRWRSLDSEVHHAENTAILQIASYVNRHGRECVLYTTVEPCIMCLSTIVLSNIRSIVFGVADRYMATREIIEKVGYIRERVHHYLGGVREAECLAALKQYGTPEDVKVITTGSR
jgi:tRNA(adenine34) deaminase